MLLFTRSLALVLSIFLTVAGPNSALARAPLVGGEWTYSNQDLIEATRSKDFWAEVNFKTRAFGEWAYAIQKRCPLCKIQKDSYQMKVSLPSGFWFEVHMDPGVFEVKTKPMSLEKFEKHAQEIQNLVWDSARDAGFTPQARLGGGHVHFDIEGHFGKDALLFRNFVVDLMNRPELFMGALSLNYSAAPPLALMPDSMHEAFKKVVAEFDALPEGSPEKSIENFMKLVNEKVYKLSARGEKNHAINLLHKFTLELRGNRPQESMDHFLKVVRLFESRIEKLKGVTTPIRYEKKDYRDYVSYGKVDSYMKYETTLPTDRIEQAFRDYVESAGLKWSDYTDLATTEFKERARKSSRVARTCRDIFALSTRTP